MKMPSLTIVQRDLVSACIAIAEGGLAISQIARKHVTG